MQADAEDFTDAQILSTCQELLTPLQDKGRLSRTWWPKMSHPTGGTCSLSNPPSW
ncbi:hypothetical protein LEMLEM_LOCUS7784, partial [Lemmus lemmus]